MAQKNLIREFSWRGLVSQSTDREALDRHLESGQRTVYCGFDPTASSLHIGSLVPLLALKRFQEFGHRPIILVGGATGLIGDPSGRDSERPLNAEETVMEWVDSLKEQMSGFLEFQGKNAAIVVNNLPWTAGRDVISFLRDIGKHFSVNAMIQRDSVKSRLAREGEGISYTEFSYMLLQSMDFLELAKSKECTIQIGGNDQWGNIVSGVDLVRRNMGKEVHALTLPLVTKSDGTKFGKTAGGSVWLDSNKTSPYSFYQYWLNVADEDAASFLKYFTFLEADEINGSVEEMKANPGDRFSQKLLANSVTELVHGKNAVDSAKRISQILFTGDVRELNLDDFQQLELDGLEVCRIESGAGLLAAMTDAGVTKSRGEARNLVKSGGVSVNSVSISEESHLLTRADALFDKYHLVRRGKKNFKLLVLENS